MVKAAVHLDDITPSTYDQALAVFLAAYHWAMSVAALIARFCTLATRLELTVCRRRRRCIATIPFSASLLATWSCRGSDTVIAGVARDGSSFFGCCDGEQPRQTERRS